MDLKAICNALAGYYAAGTITTPTGAAEGMRKSFGQTPASIPATPAVYVEVDSGDILPGAGTWDVTNHLVVHFILAKKVGDPGRNELERQIWLPTLLTAFLAHMTLGLAGVVKSALPTGYAFVETDMAGSTFDGIDVFVDVIVRETVAMAA